MGKKHKKHHKSDREIPDDAEEKPGLKLVLKVGAQSADLGHLSASPSDHGERKHKHKKKKKKKSGEKDKDRHHKHEKKRKREHLEASVKVEEVLPESVAGNEEPAEEPEAVSEIDEAPPAKRPLLMEDSHTSTPQGLRKKPSETRSELQLCLDYLHKILQRKDANGFFAFPVTDQIAPSYSTIIKQPMDFSTIKTKNDNAEYKCVTEYVNDVKLMCDNCMTYNHPDTIFYKEAKKLWSISHKTTSKDRLMQMKRNLEFMNNITLEELGIEQDDHSGAEHREEDGSRTPTHKLLERTRNTNLFEVLSSDDMTPEEILEQAQAAAQDAADMLTLRKPNSKVGFLRRRTDGSTSMTILNPDNEGIVSEKEKIVNLGALIGKVQSGSGQVTGFREDKRNKATPVTYLNYGPFSSYAPIYDSTTANVSKEDSDLLLSTYGDETGLQYAKRNLVPGLLDLSNRLVKVCSIQNFVSNSGDYAVRMVDDLLDILTQGEHSKSAEILKEREKTRELEEQRKQEEERRQREAEQAKEQPDTSSQQQDAESGATTEQKEKPPDDLNSLRSLSNLGIDMSFLDSFEKPTDSDEKDVDPNNPIQKKLTETSELLQDLEKTQFERLSQKLPVHLSNIPGPTDKENDLAEKVTSGLTELTKQATPADVTSVEGIRATMGVSLTPDPAQGQGEGRAQSSSEIQASENADHAFSDDNNDQDLEAELDELFKQQSTPFDGVQNLSPVPDTVDDAADVQMDTS